MNKYDDDTEKLANRAADLQHATHKVKSGTRGEMIGMLDEWWDFGDDAVMQMRVLGELNNQLVDVYRVVNAEIDASEDDPFAQRLVRVIEDALNQEKES